MTKRPTTYAEALRIVQDLAIQNQPDENDVAFGDPGLGAMARDQHAALETVQAYLDRDGDAALPPAPFPVPSHDRDLVSAPAGLDPRDLADAVRIVLDLGRGNVLSDDGPDMEDEVARQEAAVALVEDLVASHGPELAEAPGPGPT
jgi:hypothetical protein